MVIREAGDWPYKPTETHCFLCGEAVAYPHIGWYGHEKTKGRRRAYGRELLLHVECARNFSVYLRRECELSARALGEPREAACPFD